MPLLTPITAPVAMLHYFRLNRQQMRFKMRRLKASQERKIKKPQVCSGR